ncbi:CRTAC1 family protein [Saccharophagus degradans]|uniref:CRTAC1 family protein n=1 Tax=Saccharophagus degradans TaxID=86304 RepID=A0AAW7X3U8_9GAMM|nr:CRTAC1 family protein [Saccharophagus degradans]MBU2985126.1 CRTAC1 family protein [Saccharophagus degradans]MDO6421628.1 CRTAC1 family protein [Saccharophagus degradans]MDO6608590.1 CRTAC1 family protein [Saccharophagus degradans]
MSELNLVKSIMRFALVGLVASLAACGGGSSSPSAQKASQAGNPSGGQQSGTSNVKLFTEVSQSTNISYYQGYKNSGSLSDVQKFCGGAASGDFNNDGLTDLFIVRGDVGPHLLYKNEGNNQFTEMAAEVGLAIADHMGCGPTFADVDGDGDLDLFIGGIEGHRNYLMLNSINENGEQVFIDATEQWGLKNLAAQHTISSSFGDYDGDGWLDLFLAHWGTPARIEKQHLFRNNAGAGFINVTAQVGLASEIIARPTSNATLGENHDYSFLGSFADINNDGYTDLLMVSDFGTSKVFINSGSGSFYNTNESAIKDENGMGSAVGDIDNDGDLDWFVSAILTFDSPGNRLYQNQTNDIGALQLFSDTTNTMGVQDGGWGWAACLADFNLDGYLDIFHVNGWDAALIDLDFSKDRSRLFISEGATNQTIRFNEVARENGIISTKHGRGVVCFDSDNDGDTDLFVLGVGVEPFEFYQNNTIGGSANQPKNYLTVNLQGLAPNTQAAGARIFVRTQNTEQMREIQIGSNFISQNPVQQVFGLGQTDVVSEVLIKWPDGRSRSLVNVAANQTITVTHPNVNTRIEFK